MLGKNLGWALVIMLTSCKVSQKKLAEPKSHSPANIDSELEKTAADTEYLSAQALMYQELFNESLMTKLKDMEALGESSVEASRVPFSGQWYPENGGGTNLGLPNQATALAKYDQAFYGSAPNAVNWEKLNHNRSESWYGHCNGFSASASRHQNPKHSVARPLGCDKNRSTPCVIFEPADIRALLAEIYMNAQFRFLSGQRCRIAKENFPTRPLQDRDNPLTLDECDDLNPGTLHTALVNFIGRQKQTLILDYERDEQVWNYPLYAYKSQVLKRVSKSEAVTLIGRKDTKDYVFNPAAVQFAVVQTTLSIAEAINDNLGNEAPTKPNLSTYNYILELDGDDRILGGEWLAGQNSNTRDSRDAHPDFLWIAFEPIEPTGSSSYGNPFIKPQEVIRLWAESMDFNPENPFKDPQNPNKVLFAPSGGRTWGEFEYFSISLDQNHSGVVFLGKKVQLQVKRYDRLIGDMKFIYRINDQGAQELIVKGSEDINASFDARPGLNAISLEWQSPQGVSILKSSLKFYGMRL